MSLPIEPADTGADTTGDCIRREALTPVARHGTAENETAAFVERQAFRSTATRRSLGTNRSSLRGRSACFRFGRTAQVLLRGGGLGSGGRGSVREAPLPFNWTGPGCARSGLWAPSGRVGWTVVDAHGVAVAPAEAFAAVRGAREQRSGQVYVRSSLAPRHSDVHDEQPGVAPRPATRAVLSSAGRASAGQSGSVAGPVSRPGGLRSGSPSKGSRPVRVEAHRRVPKISMYWFGARISPAHR